MANVIHRATLEYVESVNTPNYPEPVWKHNPDMSAVLARHGASADVPQVYWRAPADWDAAGAGPVEMTPAEKAAKDAALRAAVDDDEMTETRAYVYALKRQTRIEMKRLQDAINNIHAHLRAGTTPPIGEDLRELTIQRFNARIRTKLEEL